MEEWKEYKLGELITLNSGGTPDKNNKSYWDGDIPWISAKFMYDDYLYSSELKISQDGLTSGSRLAPKGSIFLLTRGSGLFNRIPVCYTMRDLAYNQDVKCIESKNKELVSTEFLFYWLMGNKDSISAILETTGIGAGKIDTKRLKNIRISLPPKEYQQILIGFAESIMHKIEVNRRINENLEQQAQALFKSWFVDFEPFKDQPFVESELGMIPQGWKVGTLSEIADIIMGTSPSGSSYNTEGKGDVFYQGRAEFGFRFPERNLYTTEAKRFADVDTVLVSVRAPVGDINVAEEKCCIGRGLASVRSNKGFNSFILYLMQSLKPVFDRFNGEGTVFGSINKKAFEDLKVVIPDERSVMEFDSISSRIDSQIKRTVLESRRLAELRDTLLPRLMSGELKVNDLENNEI